eukprot:g42980.t1
MAPMRAGWKGSEEDLKCLQEVMAKEKEIFDPPRPGTVKHFEAHIRKKGVNITHVSRRSSLGQVSYDSSDKFLQVPPVLLYALLVPPVFLRPPWWWPMNGRWWESADRQVVAVNALEIVPAGQCSLVWVHRHRVEVPQVGDVVGGWIDHDRLQRRVVVVPLVDFGGGVARVVDLVDFWDRRGGSALSSDVVGAGAVVTFLCCSAVSGPALAMTGVCISRENSSKVVVIVFIISGRSSLERCPLVCRIVAGPGDGGSRMSIQDATRGSRVVDLDVDECAGCSPPLLEPSGSSSSPLSPAASCGGAFPEAVAF